MKAQLIKIGNSKGIRLPKSVIEQCKLEGELELVINNNKLVLYTLNKSRKGWNEAFQKMHESGNDILMDSNYIPTEWDESNWTW